MAKLPPAVIRIVEDWRARGCPPQPGVPWPRERWLASYPESADAFALLPDYLDRATVRAACRSAPESPEAARSAFVVAMAWGYGAVGYGPWRTARLLKANVDAGERLAGVAEQLAETGSLSAYGLLAGGSRLWGLGPAFGTKYLYFCPQSAAGSRALIFDRLVAKWLREHVHIRLNAASWSLGTYHRYLQLIASWAGALGAAEDEVEQCIFQAQANEEGSQWATKHAHQGKQPFGGRKPLSGWGPK
jgi:Putative 8-oxoguanine DNA glycosylase OGG-like protein